MKRQVYSMSRIAVCLLAVQTSVAQMHVAGNFSLASGTTVGVGTDLHSNADIHGNGRLALSGNTPQTLNMNTHEVPHLMINNNGGVVLESGVRIGDSLVFLNGTVRLGASDLLFSPGAVSSGADTDKYLVTDNTGVVMTEGIAGGNSFLFPVGQSAGADFTPVLITNKAGMRTLSVQVKNESFSPAVIPGTAISIDRIWQITSDVAGDADIAFTHHATAESVVFDRAAAWATQQTASGQWSTGVPSAGTNGSFTHSGSFAVPAGAGTTAFFTKFSEELVSVPMLARTATDISVFPNPFTNDTRIRVITGDAGSLSYKLTDISGKVLYQGVSGVESGVNYIPLPVAGIAPGIYLLQVTSGEIDRNIKLYRQ